MSLQEYSDLLDEVIKLQERNGNVYRVYSFPGGCEECQSTIQWDCEQCTWRENHWKYDELRNYINLEKTTKVSDCIVEKLVSAGRLNYIDLIKLGLLKDRL